MSYLRRFLPPLLSLLALLITLFWQPRVAFQQQQPPVGRHTLQIFTLCSPDRYRYLYWRLYNQNSSPVDFSWQIVGTDQGGTGTVPSAGANFGAFTLRTNTIIGDNTLRIAVDNSVEAELTADIAGCRFQPPLAGNTPAPTQVVTPLPPTHGQLTVVQGVNLRVGPGTEFAVGGSAAGGQRLEFIAYDSGWYLVINIDGSQLWLFEQFAQLATPIALTAPPATTPASATATLTATAPPALTGQIEITQGANLRDGAGASFAVVGSAAAGQRFDYLETIINDDGRWYRIIDLDGQSKWVNAALTRLVPPEEAIVLPTLAFTVQVTETLTPTPMVTINAASSGSLQLTVTSGVRLRGGPGTTYPVVGSASAGSLLPVIAYTDVGQDRWYLVMDIDGQAKWLSAGFAQLPTGAVLTPAATIPSPP